MADSTLTVVLQDLLKMLLLLLLLKEGDLEVEVLKHKSSYKMVVQEELVCVVEQQQSMVEPLALTAVVGCPLQAFAARELVVAVVGPPDAACRVSAHLAAPCERA